MASTTLNAVNSPLLRLPAELRNMIFAYVYTETVYYIDHKPGTTTFYLHSISNHEFDKRQWEADNVPLVCRQLHAEMALLPYERGGFDFLLASLWGFEGLWALERFLGQLSSKQIDAITDLRFWQSWTALGYYWERTGTAGYWVAKLEELSVCAAEMTSTQRRMFDITSIGYSDTGLRS